MNITLERCDLTCACTAGGSAVLICGVGAVSATIRKCCVHDCVSGDGVFFSSKGKLTLDENDIHSNAGAGVSVVGCGSEAILRNNHVHNGKEGGVYVVDQASATMHNNRILSNDLEASAREIADLYKRRWAIELFFRWVKQNLKIRHFLGNSENAVRIQIAVALIAYLLIHLAKADQKAIKSPLAFARLLRSNLMHRKRIDRLLKPEPNRPESQNQMAFI